MSPYPWQHLTATPRLLGWVVGQLNVVSLAASDCHPSAPGLGCRTAQRPRLPGSIRLPPPLGWVVGQLNAGEEEITVVPHPKKDTADLFVNLDESKFVSAQKPAPKAKEKGEGKREIPGSAAETGAE